MESRLCIYCNASFFPNKYSARQKVCSNIDCQKKRQLESMKLWREKNPNYFKFSENKGHEWLEKQRQRSKEWREKNPDKVRSYRKAHLSQYRGYMRDYMRKYRQGQSGATPQKPSEPDIPGASS